MKRIKKFFLEKLEEVKSERKNTKNCVKSTNL